jgi:CRP/FNR family transcriptional regulator, cyclic AMP receptor protein
MSANSKPSNLLRTAPPLGCTFRTGSSLLPRHAPHDSKEASSKGNAPHRLELFLNLANKIHVKGGSALFVAGQKAHGVFVLFQGAVWCSRPTVNGEPSSLGVFGPGAVLGLADVGAEREFHATAKALVPAIAGYIPADRFVRIIRVNLPAAITAMELLSGEYFSLLGEMEAMSLPKSAEQRISRLILKLIPPEGRDQSGGPTELILSHEEVANIIGACRETVTRALSRMERKHILSLNRFRVTVYDWRKLESRANASSGSLATLATS